MYRVDGDEGIHVDPGHLAGGAQGLVAEEAVAAVAGGAVVEQLLQRERPSLNNKHHENPIKS